MTTPRVEGARDDYETPWAVVRDAEQRFQVNFGLDAAAADGRVAKALTYFTPLEDGLSQDWTGRGTVWCNPPYGRALARWVEKAADEAARGAHVVMLIPPAVATNWWFDDVVRSARRVIFYVGRISFLIDGVPTKGKWVDSCLVEWKGERPRNVDLECEWEPVPQ